MSTMREVRSYMIERLIGRRKLKRMVWVLLTYEHSYPMQLMKHILLGGGAIDYTYLCG